MPSQAGDSSCIHPLPIHRTVDSTELDGCLDAARTGDEWAITRLLRAFHPQLLSYARHHAAVDVAEDIVAETWMAVAKGLPSFDGDADHFRGWLFAIARRRVADHYRTTARRPSTVALDDAHESATAGPEEIVLEKLTSDSAVERLLRDLPPEQAEAVLLRVVAGLSVDQVATAMGRSPGSVRVLQHRALRRLAASWQPRVVTL